MLLLINYLSLMKQWNYNEWKIIAKKSVRALSEIAKSCHVISTEFSNHQTPNISHNSNHFPHD